MIRRHVPLNDKPEKWLLISQVEHARVSAELARAWGGPQVPPVVCAEDEENPHLQEVRRELLQAIAHHDDGWASSEASPPIDNEHGRPYSFLDIPREQSLELWRDSILLCGKLGPLAGLVVAEHFLRLLDDSDDAELEMSKHWKHEIAIWSAQWLREWRALNRPVHSEQLAEECIHWLRVFDWLSLWFCCYCPTGSCEQGCEATTLDEGLLADRPVTLSPVAGNPSGWQVTAAPWPLRQPRLELDALGYAVSAHYYNSQEHLAKSRSPMRLRWQLTAG